MTTLERAPSVTRSASAAQARVAAVACLAVLVLLPVPWPVAFEAPFGIIRYVHIGVVVLLAVYGLGVGRFHGLVGRSATLLTALGAMTVVVVASAMSYGASWTEPVQKSLYALVGITFGAAVYTALRDDAGRRILVWAAPAGVTWAVVGMGLKLAAADVDPGVELGAALAGGDSGPLTRLFAIAMTVEGEAGLPSGRHEVMAALVVTILVTLLAERACRRWVRVTAWASCLLGAVIVVASLSRAVLLAVVVPILAMVVRAVLRSSRRRLVLGVAAAFLVGTVVVAWPFVRLIAARVFDTRSYTARLEAFDVGPAELAHRVLSGGPTLPVSPHSLPGDMLLLGGWLAGLCALAVVVVLAGEAVTAARRYLADGSRERLVALSAATLVLVRSVTTAGGHPYLPAWLAFGLVAALGLLARPTERG